MKKIIIIPLFLIVLIGITKSVFDLYKSFKAVEAIGKTVYSKEQFQSILIENTDLKQCSIEISIPKSFKGQKLAIFKLNSMKEFCKNIFLKSVSLFFITQQNQTEFIKLIEEKEFIKKLPNGKNVSVFKIQNILITNEESTEELTIIMKNLEYV